MNTKLENLWNNVYKSPNKEIEFDNVKKLIRYMGSKGLSFNIIVEDNSANKYKLPDDFPIDDVIIKNVYLIISKGNNKVFESANWIPKSKENIYIFFYE